MIVSAMAAMLWLLMVLPSPNPAMGGEASKLTVICPVEPVSDLARRVGGNLIRVITLLPPGADPHSFEMRPSHARVVSQGDLMFYLGLPLEEALLPKLKARGVMVIPLKFTPIRAHGHSAHRKDEVDPHAWTSVENGRSMAASMAASLKSLDPANAAMYDGNLKDLLSRMDRLDREIGSRLGRFKGGAVLAYHPAWNYFCRERGLKALAVESEGMEMRPRELAALRREVKNRGVKVMFVRPSEEGRSAFGAAKILGVRMVTLDPLAKDWFEMMRETARAFAEALGGR